MIIIIDYYVLQITDAYFCMLLRHLFDDKNKIVNCQEFVHMHIGDFHFHGSSLRPSDKNVLVEKTDIQKYFLCMEHKLEKKE